jgi:phosphoribosylformylglycinamidine synthase
VYEQYDSMVRTNSLYLTGSDAAIVRVKGTTKGLAMKTDCNSRYVYLDPYVGGTIAVSEAARNIACTGATPIGVTNCLNFGNPYDPEVFYQFKEAVRGMGDACKAFGTPVTGGNVSFYNESPDGAIYPTPTIGMIGLIEDITKVVSSDFKHEGDAIILLSTGDDSDGLGGSEYLYRRTGLVAGQAPSCDLKNQAALVQTLIELADKRLLNSAHDVSEGGLAVALTECCFAQGTERSMGAKVQMQNVHLRRDTVLFGERQGFVILSADPNNVKDILAISKKHGLEAKQIGTVGTDRLMIDDLIDESVEELYSIYSTALPAALGEDVVMV